MPVNPVSDSLIKELDLTDLLNEEVAGAPQNILPPTPKDIVMVEDEVEIILPDPNKLICAEVAEEDKDSKFGDYGDSSASLDSEVELSPAEQNESSAATQ